MSIHGYIDIFTIYNIWYLKDYIIPNLIIFILKLYMVIFYRLTNVIFKLFMYRFLQYY